MRKYFNFILEMFSNIMGVDNILYSIEQDSLKIHNFVTNYMNIFSTFSTKHNLTFSTKHNLNFSTKQNLTFSHFKNILTNRTPQLTRT